MKTRMIAFAVASLLSASTLVGQGSGTTTATATSTKTKTTSKSSYGTVHHMNGVVTARSQAAITVKQGTKTRKFRVTSATKFVGTKAARGSKVKISYRANTPGVASEVRRRG